MEWIVEAETLTDFIDHGRYTIASKPLIRCRDCKHFMKLRSEEFAKKFGQEYECECGRLNVPKPDDFCSRAKREESR